MRIITHKKLLVLKIIMVIFTWLGSNGPLGVFVSNTPLPEPARSLSSLTIVMNQFIHGCVFHVEKNGLSWPKVQMNEYGTATVLGLNEGWHFLEGSCGQGQNQVYLRKHVNIAPGSNSVSISSADFRSIKNKLSLDHESRLPEK